MPDADDEHALDPTTDDLLRRYSWWENPSISDTERIAAIASVRKAHLLKTDSYYSTADAMYDAHGNGFTPLHLAAMCKASAAVTRSLVVANLQSAQAVDDLGRLPLHFAVANGAPLESIQLILQAHPGAPAAKNRRGVTPLDIARQENETEMIALLGSYVAR